MTDYKILTQRRPLSPRQLSYWQIRSKTELPNGVSFYRAWENQNQTNKTKTLLWGIKESTYFPGKWIQGKSLDSAACRVREATCGVCRGGGEPRQSWGVLAGAAAEASRTELGGRRSGWLVARNSAPGLGDQRHGSEKPGLEQQWMTPMWALWGRHSRQEEAGSSTAWRVATKRRTRVTAGPECQQRERAFS